MVQAATKIEIFDPPLCCPSGLCGPTIDPALLDINEALLWIRKEFDGRVSVQRYLLGQQAAKFMQNQEVMKLLQSKGISVLPITAIDGRIMMVGRYPRYEELVAAINGGRPEVLQTKT